MSEPVPLKPASGCPICGKPPVPPYDPFCSKRCADLDLSRWLNGVYAVPGELIEGEVPGDDIEGGRRTGASNRSHSG